jgi:hypothetical protein
MASHTSIMSLHLCTNESTWLKMELLSTSHEICEDFEWASAICNDKSFIKTRFHKFKGVKNSETLKKWQ